MNLPVVWNFAGSDSSGTAGAQADLKTIAMHRCHGSQVMTAITAQTPDACLAVHPVSPLQLSSQIDSLRKGPVPGAIKIGMIGSAANLTAIRSALGDAEQPIVLDPVLSASSGMSLSSDIDPADLLTIGRFNNLVLTPNVSEAIKISGRNIETTEDMAIAASILLEMGAQAVLIKGGHLPKNSGKTVVINDYFADRNGLRFFINGPKFPIELRGTGCTFASALAANLALGFEIQDAAVLSKAYLNQCFARAVPLASGKHFILHQPPELTAEFMPTVSTRESPDLNDYTESPAHQTGFYVIADSTRWVKKLSDWKVPTVQLRIKNENSSPAELRANIADAVASAHNSGTALYINDHWQTAIDVKAFGVHLGQEDLLDADITAIKGAGLHLGISTHSWFEAAIALHYKPSYIALGPIFPTTCKSMRFGPQGFTKLKQWKAAWSCPVVAIGGLTVEHARELKACGADGAAVISDVLKSDQPEARTREWLNALS